MGSRGRGNVKVYIEGDSSGLGRATKQAETHLGRLGNRVSAVGSKMTSAGSTLNRGVTLPVLAIGAVAGKTAIDFDKSMRNVNSIAQLPERGLKKLERQVLQLAGPTAQAPKTLAEGLYDLVSSGFDAKESLGILDKSARAATAGLTTTEVSTAAVAAELNAYHLPAKEAGVISDQLFETVNRGVISFEDLATNIGDVLPFASSLDVGMKEVGSSISTMTKEGISAPETMTRIKNVMVTLIKPGKALSEAIKETGASSGEALVHQKGFQGALEALMATTDGSKESVAALFPNIRALGGVLALTGGNAKSANKDLAAFKDTSGATEKALSQQSKSVSYKWGKFKAELEETAIKAAPQFLDAGKEIVGDLVSMVKWFDKLSPSTKHAIIEIGLLGAALGPVLSISGNLLKVFGGTIKLADKTGGAYRRIAYGAQAAGVVSTPSAMGGSGSRSTGRSAGGPPAASTMTAYGPMASVAPSSPGINVAQAGLKSAKSFAGSLAKGLSPAIAAVGIGNILSSALEGDTKTAAWKAGGSLAGTIAGGIAGSFVGNPMLGAMVGGGIGSFLGDALSGVFDSEKKLTPLQVRLRAESEHAAHAFSAQGNAAKGLARAEDELVQKNQRHRASTQAVTRAHRELNEAVRKFGPASQQAHEAALRLARAEHKDAEAANAAKKAHKLAGNELRLYQHRTVEAVAAEKQRLPALNRVVASLERKSRQEPRNYTVLNKLVTKEREQAGVLRHLSDLYEQGAVKSSPKFARGLERMTVAQAHWGKEMKARTRQFPELGRESELTVSNLTRNWGHFTDVFHSGTGKARGDVKSFASGTKGGFKEVETSLSNALTSLGVKSVSFTTTAAPGKARGGMMRVPGQGREDIVPLRAGGIEAVVAPGEDLIVANRHQRPELDFAVATAFGDKGLPGFFRRSNRPHHLAKGGVVHPSLSGPDPMQDMGQHSIDRVYGAARRYYRRHAEPARVRNMYSFAQAEAAKGYPYVYGGGHGSFSGPYDCSGYVSAVLHAGKFISSPMSVQQGSGLYTLGEAGPGKFFTWGVRGSSGQNAHTMISVKGPRGKWGYFEAGGSGGGAHENSGWDGGFQLRHMSGFAGGGIVPPRKARDAIAKYGRFAFDPKSRHFVGWGYQRGGVPLRGARFGSGGLVVEGNASYEGGTGNSTADGSHTDEDPGFAIRDSATLGDWFWAEVGGASGMLQHTDWGPAEWTGRAIDFTEAGLKKIGAPLGITDKPAKVTWLGNTVAGAAKNAKKIGLTPGGGSKESAQERKEKTPVHGRTKLSYEEKVSKADTRIAKAGTTAGLKDDRHAAVAKLDLIRGRKRYLEKKVRGINNKLKGKLKPPVREKLLQQRESYLGELSGIPGEASSLIESLRESGVGQKGLKKYAHGLGIGVADPNAEKVTARDRADLQLARAERTPDKGDDLSSLEKLVGVSQQELKAAQKSRNPKRIAEAVRNLKDANDAVDALRLAIQEATPTATDFANRDLALAELTESKDDDRAALEKLKELGQQQLDEALKTADPRDDIEAAQNLKSVTEALKSLEETISEVEQQRREFEEERLEVDKRLATLAETQGPAFAAGLLAWIDGGIGGPLQTRARLATAGVSAGYQ